MAKGRFGRSRATRRYYGRRAARRVARGGNKLLAVLGFSKTGVHVGRVLGWASIPMSALMEPWPGARPVDYIVSSWAKDATTKAQIDAMGWSRRLEFAMRGVSVNYTGMGAPDATYTKGTGAGKAGYVALAGAGLTLGGKVINPMLGGFPLKG